MAEIVNQITDAQNNGTINVYAVRYSQSKKDENFAVALPGNMDSDLRKSFCENVINYQDKREVAFNPMIEGLEIDTYESVPIVNVQEKWDEIFELLNDAVDYYGKGNRKKVPFSNLYVCALDYQDNRYYLFAKQGNNSDKLFRGKWLFLNQQDELKVIRSNEVFAMSTFAGFMIDTVENEVLIFDKKVFQDVFKYDDYQKKIVQNNIAIVEQWKFLSSADLIKNRSSQKNVYSNLAKIFADQLYMEQIRTTAPAQLKANLLAGSPECFNENDFEGDRLKVTAQNLDTIMKMLAKGFKFNFFANVAEQ